jgi:Alginate export
VDAQEAPPAPETLAVGDWQLAPVVEARVRGEYRHGLAVKDSGLLVERARLGVDAQRGVLEAHVVLQDARELDLGGGTRLQGTPLPFALTGVYEAWGEGHSSSARPSYVRIGRQPIAWGEGRLLGTADWSPAARPLDAVRARVVVRDSAFELLAAVLTDPALPVVAAYGELFGVRGELAFDPLLAIEAYVLARFAQESPSVDLENTVRGETYTGALRAHGDSQAWSWGAEGAMQLGRVPHFAEDRLAWAAAGRASYAFERALGHPTVHLGVAFASGDGGGSTYRAFDPLLPDVHSGHGAMDLFAWSNEEEANIRLTAAPWTDGLAGVEYRYVRLAEPGGAWRSAYLATIAHTPDNTQGELGHEVDAFVAWSPWAPLDLSAGYSVFVLGDGARNLVATNQLGLTDVSHFAYGQVELKVP